MDHADDGIWPAAARREVDHRRQAGARGVHGTRVPGLDRERTRVLGLGRSRAGSEQGDAEPQCPWNEPHEERIAQFGREETVALENTAGEAFADVLALLVEA